MKFILLTLTLVWLESSHAQISVDHNWSFDRKTWIRYDYSSGGFVGIGRKREIFDVTTNWRAPLKYSLVGDGENSIIVGTVGSSANTSELIFGEDCYYPDDLKNLKCLFLPKIKYNLSYLVRMDVSISDRTKYLTLANSVTTNRSSEVATKINGNSVVINVNDYLYSDRQGVRYMKFHTDKIHGNVKINVPLDNKFISFQKKIKMDGIFNPNLSPENLIKVEGSNFKSAVDINTRDKWETVWTLPGQTNYIQVQIGDPATNNGLGLGTENDRWHNIGIFELEFAKMYELLDSETIKKNFGLNQFTKENLNETSEQILNFENVLSNSNEILFFRNELLGLVSTDFYKNAVLANYSLSDVGKILDSLSQILIRLC